MKKQIAAILLAAMLTSLAACGQAAEETGGADAQSDTTAADTSVQAEETRASHAVPETDFDGAVFHSLYLDWQGYKHYFFADESNGDVMNDAVYDRTLFVEEFLNVDITSEADPDYISQIGKIKSTVTAGDDVYDNALIHCIFGVAELPTGGYIRSIDDMPHLALDQEWWNKNQMDVLRLGNNTYYGVSDYMLPCPYAIYFNKEIIVNNDMDNPYELVYEGKWTLDKFVDMAISVVRDVNGDGKVVETDDMIGITCDETSKFTSFMTGADQFITERGEDGRIGLVLNNERTVGIIEKISRLNNVEGAVVLARTLNETDVMSMDTGRLLFRLGTIETAEFYRQCEADIGILPYPKYDETQENYVSQDWGGLMAVPASVSEPDMVGSVMELLAWDSANNVIPTYYDVTLSGKLSRDEDTRAMVELLFDTISYEVGGNYFGFSDGFNSLFYVLGNHVIKEKTSDFASFYARFESKAQTTIDKFYEDLGKIEN